MIRLTILNNVTVWVIVRNSNASAHCNSILEFIYNGIPHNRYKPAITFRDSTSRWLINGKRHRLDGPAIESDNGRKYWYVDDFEYDTYLEYLVAVEQYKLKKEVT